MSQTLKNIVVTGVISAIFFVVSGLYFNVWYDKKLAKIEMGFADSIFPYREYTEDELNKMFPQTIEPNVDIPTRTTPEETYTKFRQALKENNLQMAIEQLYNETGYDMFINFWNKNNVKITPKMEIFAKGYGGMENKKYEENVKDLTKAYRDGKFMDGYEGYPEKIEKIQMNTTVAEYEYDRIEEEKVFVNSVHFRKNLTGDWKMESL